jgi:hypothetical protein
MTTPKKLWIALLFAALAALSVWLLKPRYYLAETAGSHLVCNSRECYLFIGQGKDGWKASGLRLIANYFVAMLRGANPPTDIRGETIVFAVRSQGVERYWFPGLLHPEKIYRDTLYVAHAKQVDRNDVFYSSLGRVVRPEDFSYGKWTGTGLEQVSAEKKKEVDRAQDALWSGKGESNEPGLWRREFEGWVWVDPLAPDHPVRINLESGSVTITTKGDLTNSQSIVLTTPGGQEQTLWTIQFRQHRVSQEEYRKAFAGL